MPLIQYLSRILFEFGAVSVLASEIERLGLARPLLVTDKGVAAAGILERVLTTARPYEPVVYDGTTENPNEASLLDCLQIWKDEGCDGVIALGGGSAIDLSKAIVLVASHGGSIGDYNVRTGGSEKIGKVKPQIAIPTAAGTGAEVGRACVMSLNSGEKIAAVNLNMVADTVICDPELTLSLPSHLTAATGIDALSHGIEATMSTVDNPPAAAIALDCIARAVKWLPVAVADGRNLEARREMMMAALEGGMCLQKSLGGGHAMANPLGELHLHHGTLMGIVLPHILAFNADAAPDAAGRIRQAAGIAPDRPLHEWMSEFTAGIGLPQCLSDLRVDAGVLPEMAEKAAREHLSATNPRKATADDYLGMLTAAL